MKRNFEIKDYRIEGGEAQYAVAQSEVIDVLILRLINDQTGDIRDLPLFLNELVDRKLLRILIDFIPESEDSTDFLETLRGCTLSLLLTESDDSSEKILIGFGAPGQTVDYSDEEDWIEPSFLVPSYLFNPKHPNPVENLDLDMCFFALSELSELLEVTDMFEV